MRIIRHGTTAIVVQESSPSPSALGGESKAGVGASHPTHVRLTSGDASALAAHQDWPSVYAWPCSSQSGWPGNRTRGPCVPLRADLTFAPPIGRWTRYERASAAARGRLGGPGA